MADEKEGKPEEAPKEEPAAAAPAAEASTDAPAAEAPPVEAPPAEGGDEKEDKLAQKKAAAKEAAKKSLSAITGVFSGFKKGIVSGVVGIITLPFAMFRGDLISKILAVGFFASVLLLFYSSTRIYDYVMERFGTPDIVSQEDSIAATKISDFVKNQKALTLKKKNLIYLKKFSTNLKSKTGNVKLFEVEFYVEADKLATSEYIKAHKTQIREVIGTAIRYQSYEALLTDEGKERLKYHVIKVVNKLLKKNNVDGGIVRVFLTRLVMAS